MRRYLFVPALLYMLLPLAVQAQTRDDRVVACWDSARGIVQQTRADRCEGQIVSQTRAEALQRYYERERRERIARAERLRLAEAARGLRFKSAGTAFAVNRDGDLVTSAHVITGCDAIELRDPDSARRLPVTVKHVDAAHDLALVHSGWRARDHLRFAPSLPRSGEPLALVGFPHEGRIRIEPSLTPVRVDYALRDPDDGGLTGITGDVRRGHSGGPALDSRGRITGVLKAKIDSVAAHRASGQMLKHLGVLVDPRRVVRMLERAETRYWIDGTEGTERTGRELFASGRAAVVRIDCLTRK